MKVSFVAGFGPVESADAVAEVERELVAHGHRLLRPTREGPWQVTARFLSPEGRLVAVSYTP
jgi:hypothetical protein